MALFQIGSATDMVNQASNALGSNAITNALGMDFGSVLTPSKFLTKFSPSTVFTYRSLAYTLRTAKNFDVIFHWFPKCSQIRTYFSQAFSAADSDEVNLLVRDVTQPRIQNTPIVRNEEQNSHFRGAVSGKGVNANGQLSMTFLNTEFSYIDHCFYQWISETESPYWIYGPSLINNDESVKNLKSLGELIYYKGQMSVDQAKNWISYGDAAKMIYLQSQSEVTPFTRADIEVKYYSSNMKELHSVWYMGAFPVSIEMQTVENKNEFKEGYRVDFIFDSVCISTPFGFNKSDNSLTNGVSSALGGLSNTGSWAAGLIDDTLTQIGNTYLDKASKKLNSITTKAGNKLSSKVQ